MRLLLDSHALLWWQLDDPKLPDRARVEIAAPANTVFVSAASYWELAIKFSKHKLPQAQDLLAEVRLSGGISGFDTLPINAEHAVLAGTDSSPHPDPFDRMLIAQARSESLTLVSNEKLFDQFGINRLWQ